DFIKADIEGWELNMLKGAQKTLARYRPAVMIEINDDALVKAGASRQALIDFMQAQGYKAAAEVDQDVVFLHAA
ncbi:MAG: FkbM family methyltransferase, partial [Bdellovibrionales bacterium]|nr:FkbM family methyltransferase [Bdellovibrionales bacterium]